MGELVGLIWKVIFLQPIMNTLIVLTHWLFGNFGLAIIALTIVSRVILYPLSIKQQRSTKAVQELQPKMAELQRKYGQDRQRLAKEQMALYREVGMSPTGCLLPTLVQLPIWIALYQSITRVLAIYPEDFLQLSQYLYSWETVHTKLPLERSFLWLDLAVPDSLFLMPLLVGGTMWIQQKMITVNSTDPQQRQQSATMLWMMPIMFTLFTLSFPSGLAVYWVISNIIAIGMQYFVSGWGGMAALFGKKQAAPEKKAAKVLSLAPTKEEASPAARAEAREEGLSDEESRDKRQERRGSPAKRTGAPRRQTRRGKSNRPKRR